MANDNKTLTPKQQRFIKEYLIDLNATQAAIRAGYSEKTASQIGEQNLRKLEIQAAVNAAVAERSERTKITQDMVLQEIAKLSFSNMLDYITINKDGLAYVDLSQITRDQAAAIQEITVDEYVDGKGEDARDVKKVKIKLADKRGSLELLGRHLKMFTDKVERTGANGGPIDIKITVGDIELNDNDTPGDKSNQIQSDIC